MNTAMRVAHRIAAGSFLLALAAVGFQGGAQLIREGKLEEALAAYRAEAEASPKSIAANNGAGVVLDLMGRYPEAQRYFAQAIKAARTPLERATAQRAMAISHGFAGDCKGAEKYETSAFEFYLGTGDFYNAGEVADELGRLCLDAGDLTRASEWYWKGHDTGLEEPNIGQDRKDLWKFRVTHAQARIAARRGKAEEARKHVMAARALLDKGTNPAQEEIFSVPGGICGFLRRRLSGGAGRLAARVGDRSIYSVHDRADLRSNGRPGTGAGVLPQGREQHGS